jgi:hypothetical protein
VRGFIARPDEFRRPGVGEAYVWSALGPPVERVHVTQAVLSPLSAAPAAKATVYEPAGPTRLPARRERLRAEHEELASKERAAEKADLSAQSRSC